MLTSTYICIHVGYQGQTLFTCESVINVQVMCTATEEEIKYIEHSISQAFTYTRSCLCAVTIVILIYQMLMNKIAP